MKKFHLLIILVLLISFLALPNASQAIATTISSGNLIKADTDSVYYYGADAKRYVFPNLKTYQSWYGNDFSDVVVISKQLLASIPIGGNVTYKPGNRLVKITTDPRVYWVDRHGALREITKEGIAVTLFGSNWIQLIDDVPDSFFSNYTLGEPISQADLPKLDETMTINSDIVSFKNNTNDSSSITLSGSVSGNVANLSWTTSGLEGDYGFKILKSDQPSPVYPGSDYHYNTDISIKTDEWENLSAGTYHFRICQYIAGVCSTYSNNLILTIDNQTEPIDKNINLTAEAVGSKVILDWTSNFNSENGYKVLISDEPNPVYPGSDYHYKSEPAATQDVWSNLSNGIYHFRICEYLGGTCGTYSNDLEIEITGNIYDNNGSITLSGYYDEAADKIFLSWTVLNLYSAKGFKVVHSNNPDPVYPGNEYHYYSNPEIRDDHWYLQPGIHYFRTCEYLGGACGIYSNNLVIVVQ